MSVASYVREEYGKPEWRVGLPRIGALSILRIHGLGILTPYISSGFSSIGSSLKKSAKRSFGFFESSIPASLSLPQSLFGELGLGIYLSMKHEVSPPPSFSLAPKFWQSARRAWQNLLRHLWIVKQEVSSSPTHLQNLNFHPHFGGRLGGIAVICVNP
ncbi:hypothetical protein PIB30_064999 [Stylosanthes scabra]|uniref:Uncharacterized protein n=1 Tax=Stylosanthes scabra TaxID=79078 RepID=A0ABU6TP96_9FABA|nr:hypothetical protein [Stylosanthes scabra]